MMSPFGPPLSDDQHGVPEAKESVFLRNRFGIREKKGFPARERRTHHQHRGARHVEVGEHSVHHLEPKAGTNEQCRNFASGANLTRTGRHGFQRSH